MKKHFFLTLISFFFCSLLWAQNYREAFLKHLKAEDSTAQIELLVKWEQAQPDDPELFVSYFNHYFMQGREEVLSLNAGIPSGESLQLQDSSGKVVGFMGSRILYDYKAIEKGISYINQGISKYPSRLDMRFGKIYVYGQMEDWESFTQEILKTISYSNEIGNQWTWSNGETVEDGEAFFLSNIQSYQHQLFATEEDSLLSNMRRIAEQSLIFYPNDVPSLSNLSITYLLTEKYDEALEPLFKAQKIDPRDGIVLNNIARAYVLKGDKKKALKYYKKVIKYGDEDGQAYAEKQIARLKEDKK